MSFIYNGSHSIHFIEALDSSTNSTPTAYSSKINSWNDLHLIPLTRSSIVTPSPSIKLIEVPGTNSRIDLTDLQPGGLKYGVRSGSWKFAIDHYKYTDWHTAKKTIENALNGKRLYCVLDDDLSSAYRGRFSIESWESGVTYSSITIKYQLEAKRYTNAFNIISTATEAKMIASWVEVDEAIRDGSYRTKYHAGDLIYLTIGGEYNGYAEIAGLDTDVDTSNNTIPITWILKNVLETPQKMTSSSSSGATSGGWPSCDMRGYVANTIRDKFPARINAMLRITKKISRDVINSTDLTSYDYIWIPSYREVYGGTTREQSGVIYSSTLNTTNKRMKTKVHDTIGRNWYLRSACNDYYYECITSGGSRYNNGSTGSQYILLGFCTGAST